MGNKSTQYFKLQKLLASAPEISKETVAKELGVKIHSVPVYIHALKHKFKAEIKNIKNGRQVIAYKLINKDAVKVPQYRSNAAGTIVKTAKPKTVKVESGVIAVPDKDLEITKIDAREMSDIHSSLGIDIPRTGSDY